MQSTRKYLWIVVFVVMVFVVVSGGCGGSGGWSVSEPDNNAWDTDPYPYNVNQPENDDDTGDNTPNPQPEDTGNSSPVVISGTWEIVSGYGITSNDVSGNLYVNHYTYAPGKNTEVNIKMSKSTYSHLGYYSATL